jgi:tetratricopeptide (TPR) repeat protein
LVLPFVGLSSIAAAVVEAQWDESQDVVCGEATAYDRKLDKAERKLREEEAKQEAFDDLGLRAWTEAFGGGVSPSREDDHEVFGVDAPNTDRRFASLRSRYRVNQRFGGGEYAAVGNKQKKTVLYCLPRRAYDDAIIALREQRQWTIRDFRIRFAEMEQLVRDEPSPEAAKKLTRLAIEVVNEAMDRATYESRVDGRKSTFEGWLREWGDILPRGSDYVEFLNERAEELMHLGHLDEADRYLYEALAADRQDERAWELRRETQARRVRRVELLDEAEELARRGRFQAADRRLDEAAWISRDDPLALEDTAKTINGLQAAFREYNPPKRIAITLSFGSLGLDTAETDERVRAETGVPVESGPLTGIGVGGSFRLGRFYTARVSGGWAFSQDQQLQQADRPLELYSVVQLTGGVGYRTLRSAKRSYAISILGGAVWEWVDISPALDITRSDSASQSGLFLRMAVEWKTTSIFVSHGLGFDSSPDSVIGWSNSLEIGVAFGF